MGIRFSCHGCGKPLNIKSELAGRRGVCPECHIRFRIPVTDTEFSSPVESRPSDTSAVRESRGEAVIAAGSESAVASVAGVGTAVVDEPPARPVAPATTQSLIDALASDNEATWYVRPPSGGQYGPATGQVLKSWIEEGRVARNALLWRDGWLQWRDASEALPEIASTLPGGGNEGGFEGEPQADLPPMDAMASAIESPNVVTAAVNTTTLSGNSDIGSVRRKRSSNRLTLITILGVVVIGLCVTLAIVATMRG